VIRAIRADYTDMATSRGQVKPLEKAIQESGFNLVSLGAGRAEWTYFKWNGHNADWSNDVKSTGIDFLAEDSGRFGAWAHIDAAVDVLSPLYIQKNPGAAAISLDGVPSSNLISTMPLVEGPDGQHLLHMLQATSWRTTWMDMVRMINAPTWPIQAARIGPACQTVRSTRMMPA
jgi:hypothetical protein